MLDDSWIDTTDHGNGVVQLRMNCAPVNAMTARTLRGLQARLDWLIADDAVRAIVLSSAFGVFCAGLNLKSALSLDEEGVHDVIQAMDACYLALYACPKPVIAAVAGPAIAGGLFLVLASDHRVAGTKAQFGLSEVRVGVGFPMAAKAIAHATLSADGLRRLALRGQPVGTEAALKLGMIDRIVPGNEVTQTALRDAEEFAAMPPRAFAKIKRQLRGDCIRRIEEKLGSRQRLWFNDETLDAMRRMVG